MQKLFTTFKSDESGATAIEYGLIAALIAVAIIGAVSLLGLEVSAVFQDMAKGLQKRPPVT
jgi:pilus assembly protein Flp/PilA